MVQKKACKSCLMLSEEDACPACKGDTSKDWQGFLVVADFSRSQIAEKMSIKNNGKYALRVR